MGPIKEGAKTIETIDELEDAQWGYDEAELLGPSNWHKKYGKCAGRRQSPIAFYADDIVEKKDLTDIIFEGYDKEIGGSDLYVHNTGHTFEIDVADADHSHLRISGGGLPTWYQLVQFHFHWSYDDEKGSEHVVGDTRNYPLVIHWVHTKEGMPVKKALELDDGLAVLAVTFELVEFKSQRNTELDKITKHLQDVKFRTQKEPINENLILRNLFPEDTYNYFRYNGSLTTPPCSEAVIWTVFLNTINVTKMQLHEFRHLYTTDPDDDRVGFIDRNYRLQMPLNDRVVWIREKVDDLPERAGARALRSVFVSICIAVFLRGQLEYA